MLGGGVGSRVEKRGGLGWREDNRDSNVDLLTRRYSLQIRYHCMQDSILLNGWGCWKKRDLLGKVDNVCLLSLRRGQENFDGIGS